MQNHFEPLSYIATVRLAHALADRLKKTRPALRYQADELQNRVTRAHRQLQEIEQLAQTAVQVCEHEGRRMICSPTREFEATLALNDLNAACQALRDLLRSTKAVLPNSPSLPPIGMDLSPLPVQDVESTSRVDVEPTHKSKQRHPFKRTNPHRKKSSIKSALAKFRLRLR